MKKKENDPGFLKSDNTASEQDEIRRSGLFDDEWYLQRYPDVADAGMDPLAHFMAHGWKEMRHPNTLFDTKWYLDSHPDVREHGMNPLLHYVRHGALELRDTGADFRPSVFQDPRTSRGTHHLAAANAYLRKVHVLRNQRGPSGLLTMPRVLIIAELSIPQCRKYRVDQKAEMLRRLGYASTVLNWHDVAQCEAALEIHSLVIFYRVPAVSTVLGYIERAKELHLPNFWEVDDLIFDPNAYLQNSSLKVLTPELQRSVLSGVPLYRAAMLACDEAIASTHSLAEAMLEAGMKKAYVVENALDMDTLEAATKAVKHVPKPDNWIRIVYGSGTKTHDKDFLEASDAILACMAAHPRVKLRIVGELGLPKQFAGLTDRVERFEGTSYDKYLELMAACDIAIAPLEPNLFNDAKSNIKFIEAAMTGLPSVCSPRAEFTSIIKHGQNGFLAQGREAWRASLEALILDRTLRRSMASLAEKDVLARYDPQNIAQTQLAPVISKLANVGTPRKLMRILSANVFFEPRSFGGATIVAEKMAHLLHARDDTEVLVFTTAPGGTAEPYTLLNYNAGTIPVFALCLPETHDPQLDFDTPYTLHRFREVLQMTKPDVVHLHSIQGLGARLMIVCEEENIPVVVTLHDAWWICARQFMIKNDGFYCFQDKIDLNICSNCAPDAGLNVYRQYRLRDMLERAAMLLAPSEFFRGIYAANGFSPERLKVNRNGIARPVDFRRKPAKTLRFGFVGGNSGVKGADHIRKVFSSLERSDYQLVLVDNLLSLGFSSINAADWPISGELNILPAYDQDTMDDFYAQIDVLLFPTQWKESFGLTVREALIRDTWVIATDAGGVVEDIVDGENGDIIPLLDNGIALKAAVERALDRSSELMAHTNPYKNNIADHAQQASELHGILTDVIDRSKKILATDIN